MKKYLLSASLILVIALSVAFTACDKPVDYKGTYQWSAYVSYSADGAGLARFTGSQRNLSFDIDKTAGTITLNGTAHSYTDGELEGSFVINEPNAEVIDGVSIPRKTTVGLGLLDPLTQRYEYIWITTEFKGVEKKAKFVRDAEDLEVGNLYKIDESWEAYETFSLSVAIQLKDDNIALLTIETVGNPIKENLQLKYEIDGKNIVIKDNAGDFVLSGSVDDRANEIVINATAKQAEMFSLPAGQSSMTFYKK